MADIMFIGAIFFFIFALVTLAVSALYLVRALSQIGKKIGISSFVMGIVVLSVVTSTPEFLNVLISASRGLAELGIGDIIGASIVDLCLVLGVVSLFAKSKFGKTENIVFGIAILAVITFYALCRDGVFSRFDGLIMFIFFITYQIYLYKQGVSSTKRNPKFKSMAIAYAMVPITIFSLVIASTLLVSTSSLLALSVGIPVGFVGLVFVAIGTASPELTSSIAAAIKKGEGLALGTLIGSVIVNFFFAGGLAAVIYPFSFNFEEFFIPLMFLLGSLIFFMIYANVRKETDRLLGISLILIYLVYLYFAIGAI